MAYIYGLLWRDPWEEGKPFQIDSSEISFSTTTESRVRIVLDKNRTYQVGIDQSGKCCGIAIVDTTMDFILIMDVLRNFNQTGGVDGYFRQIYNLVSRMLEGVRLEFFAMEQIPPIRNTMYTNKYLAELRGIVKGWFYTIPALQALPDNQVFDILPAEWKHFVYIKPKGKAGRRFHDKSAIASDICVQFPQLSPHLITTQYVGTSQMEYDAFDAFGIVNGVGQKNFDENGNRINAATKKRIQALLLYRYVEYPTKDHCPLFDGFESVVSNERIMSRQYNKDYSVMDNVYMAIGNSEENWVCMEVVSSMHLLGVAIEYNLELKPGYVLFMLVGPVKIMNESFKNHLLQTEPMIKYLR